ncbi:MAG TPA: aminotransferase class I/II-fold pyridoxal phosphate-dependent enzyme, partial [Deltaproteobacteria bacterium]|nr:aminotransferase class I/II-fold pyridoxal phosphate-dependent enzyme [Deltaproteobacteria bacterium]
MSHAELPVRRPVPMVDLARRHAEVADEVEDRVLQVLRSGRWVGGPVVAEAEARLAGWLSRQGAVGVASGTDALMLALQAVGIRPGDEVIVPALTFFATAGAVAAVGATPVIADVGEDGLLDPTAAGALISPRTRAVIPVHLFGNRAEDPGLGLTVIDDAAQAIGTTPPPSIGRLTAVSAYPTKSWGAAGDAGFVAGDEPELLEAVRCLASHGQRGAPHHHEAHDGQVGRASRLDAIQAAVLLGHADQVEARIDRRRRLADRYDAGLPASIRPLPRQHGSSVHQYCVLASDRARVVAALDEAG